MMRKNLKSAVAVACVGAAMLVCSGCGPDVNEATTSDPNGSTYQVDHRTGLCFLVTKNKTYGYTIQTRANVPCTDRVFEQLTKEDRDFVRQMKIPVVQTEAHVPTAKTGTNQTVPPAPNGPL